ncbi:MAG: hypothetical protein KKC75_03345 [Nanoarchaeota archaeon]|nr:hypothetical protein [Nanoarchaeota archaeon]MBU1947014.1 hypothetical protein [Nanoarchaeota archaeon]
MKVKKTRMIQVIVIVLVLFYLMAQSVKADEPNDWPGDYPDDPGGDEPNPDDPIDPGDNPPYDDKCSIDTFESECAECVTVEIDGHEVTRIETDDSLCGGCGECYDQSTDPRCGGDDNCGGYICRPNSNICTELCQDCRRDGDSGPLECVGASDIICGDCGICRSGTCTPYDPKIPVCNECKCDDEGCNNAPKEEGSEVEYTDGEGNTIKDECKECDGNGSVRNVANGEPVVDGKTCTLDEPIQDIFNEEYTEGYCYNGMCGREICDRIDNIGDGLTDEYLVEFSETPCSEESCSECSGDSCPVEDSCFICCDTADICVSGSCTKKNKVCNSKPVITGSDLGVVYGKGDSFEFKSFTEDSGEEDSCKNGMIAGSQLDDYKEASKASNVRIGDAETKFSGLTFNFGKREDGACKADGDYSSGLTYEPDPEVKDEDLPKAADFCLKVTDKDTKGEGKLDSTVKGVSALLCPDGDVEIGRGIINLRIIAEPIVTQLKVSSVVEPLRLQTNVIKIYFGPDEDKCGLPSSPISLILFIQSKDEKGMNALDLNGADAFKRYVPIPGVSFREDIIIPKPDYKGKKDYKYGKNYELTINIQIEKSGNFQLKMSIDKSYEFDKLIKKIWAWPDVYKHIRKKHTTKPVMIGTDELKSIISNLNPDKESTAEIKCTETDNPYSIHCELNVYLKSVMALFQAWMRGSIDSNINGERLIDLYQCCPRIVDIIPRASTTASSTNSFYLLRDKDNFTYSGIAYHFGPEGILFNNGVNITIDESDIHDMSDLYSFHFTDDEINEQCDIQLIDEDQKTIDSNPNFLEAENIRIDFPEDTLSQPTDLFIKKVMLDCQKINETPQEDTDKDGIYDENDNCYTMYNPSQEDINGNGIGDICEPYNSRNLPEIESQLWNDVSVTENNIELNLLLTKPAHVLISSYDPPELVYSNQIYYIEPEPNPENASLLVTINFNNPADITDPELIKPIFVDPSEIDKLLQHYDSVNNLFLFSTQLDENNPEYHYNNINIQSFNITEPMTVQVNEINLGNSNFYSGDWNNDKILTEEELLNVINKWILNITFLDDAINHIEKGID